MASSLLDSTAAFEERAHAFGVEAWVVTKFKEKNLNTFGRFALAVAFNPQGQNDKPFVDYVENLAESTLGQDQLAALRRLLFESHTLALADVRIRVESSPDPATASRKLPTAERLARQTAQQSRLGGIIFNPDTIPANQLVDTFVEMLEHNTLSYVKPGQCISRAQEVSAVKKDPTISTDSQGIFNIASKLHWACTVGLCGVVCGVGGWDPFLWGCVLRCAFATTSDIPDESSISLFLVMCHSVTFGCQLLFLAVKLSDAIYVLCCAFIVI